MFEGALNVFSVEENGERGREWVDDGGVWKVKEGECEEWLI